MRMAYPSNKNESPLLAPLLDSGRIDVECHSKLPCRKEYLHTGMLGIQYGFGMSHIHLRI